MPDILPITDTEIDDVIKVAPIEVALDPNKTQGRNHRGLIKKIRDYFVQEVSKKLDKANPVATGTIQGPGEYPVYLGSAEGIGNSTGYVGFNAKRNEATGVWTIGGDSVGSNGGSIIFSDIDGDLLRVNIPSTGVGTDQTKTDAEILALAVDMSGANKADKDLTIFTYTASHTLVLANRGGMVRMNVASANTLTVPPNSSVAFPVGTQIVWSQPGAGQTTFVAGSGVTITPSYGGGLKSAGIGAGGTLIKVGTDVWELHGNIRS